jgi:hypothetical protein
MNRSPSAGIEVYRCHAGHQGFDFFDPLLIGVVVIDEQVSDKSVVFLTVALSDRFASNTQRGDG